MNTKDLPDSQRDKERLKQDKATIDLPDVKDIPGQEHIQVPPLGELADTTISSDDEEGTRLLDDDTDRDADVTPAEKRILEESAETMPTQDDTNLRRAELDNTDFDGDLLNEDEDVSGDDLDVPGAEDDDANEEIGEEDEENNPYSLSDNN